MSYVDVVQLLDLSYGLTSTGLTVHYTVRNDETLCGKLIHHYIDEAEASRLIDELKTYGLCAGCYRSAKKRKREIEALPAPFCIKPLCGKTTWHVTSTCHLHRSWFYDYVLRKNPETNEILEPISHRHYGVSQEQTTQRFWEIYGSFHSTLFLHQIAQSLKSGGWTDDYIGWQESEEEITTSDRREFAAEAIARAEWTIRDVNAVANIWNPREEAAADRILDELKSYPNWIIMGARVSAEDYRGDDSREWYPAYRQLVDEPEVWTASRVMVWNGMTVSQVCRMKS